MQYNLFSLKIKTATKKVAAKTIRLLVLGMLVYHKIVSVTVNKPMLLNKYNIKYTTSSSSTVQLILYLFVLRMVAT